MHVMLYPVRALNTTAATYVASKAVANEQHLPRPKPTSASDQSGPAGQQTTECAGEDRSTRFGSPGSAGDLAIVLPDATPRVHGEANVSAPIRSPLRRQCLRGQQVDAIKVSGHSGLDQSRIMQAATTTASVS